MKRILFIISSRNRPGNSALLLWAGLSLVFCASLVSSPCSAGSWEYVFFQDTQYPLKVCYIQGDKPGPTVMVQGGIQGDEPSGFVTAQILSRSKVSQGNLIVLPRANVPSINLARRQINVDMNRRFDQNYNRFYEDRVARVIRFFLAQSDAFIHLHEGSGFYSPTYVDASRNPMRYGQSIIVDALKFKDHIDLGATASSVIKQLNNQIATKDYRFELFNTRTFEPGTEYPEMRKSLTCYALSELGIPAMAVEVSKSIKQLNWKVHQHLMATLILLERFGVVVEPPTFGAEEVQAYAKRGVAVRVNGRDVTGGGEILLTPGVTLAVDSASGGQEEFSPSLALFASDRPGVNLIQARRMALEPFAELELRSDGLPLAKTKVRWNGNLPKSLESDQPVFVCWLNGNPVFVRNGEALEAVMGDQLILEGIWGSARNEVINFKGFVAIPWANNGQDMGWEIILDPDNFMDKYRMKSPLMEVARYKVVRDTPGVSGASFYLDIVPRAVLALMLKDQHGQSLLIPWNAGGSYRLPPGDYVLSSAWSNGPGNKLVATADKVPLRPGDKFRVDFGKNTDLTVRLATTFAAVGTMTFTPGNFVQR